MKCTFSLKCARICNFQTKTTTKHYKRSKYYYFIKGEFIPNSTFTLSLYIVYKCENIHNIIQFNCNFGYLFSSVLSQNRNFVSLHIIHSKNLIRNSFVTESECWLNGETNMCSFIFHTWKLYLIVDEAMEQFMEFSPRTIIHKMSRKIKLQIRQSSVVRNTFTLTTVNTR